MAVGVLGVLSLAGSSAIYYSSANARSASYSKTSATAYSLAEAGIAHALSILGNTLDPSTATLLPQKTFTLDAGTVTYSGVLAGNTWTITSTGKLANPAGAADVERTLTKIVQLSGLTNGGSLSAWDRLYQGDAATCMTIPTGITIPSNVTAKGNLCLQSGAFITGSTTEVNVGGNVTIGATATGIVKNAGSGAGWTNSGNIGTNDNIKATTSVAAGAQSPNLDATNFGFAIPSGVTIVGVSARIEQMGSAKDKIADTVVQLIVGGTATGSNLPSATKWDDRDKYQPYGSSATMWGLSLTPAQVNASNFGLRLRVTNTHTSAVTASVDHVELTVYYMTGAEASIGTAGAPVAKADVAGTCTFSTLAPHTPCSAVDNVFASSILAGPTNLGKPTVDFAYWFANAKPGPKYPCTHSTGTPPAFDSQTPATATYNASNASQELTPESRDYTCQVKDGSGNILGELSWNRTTRELKIAGTIFFDGDAIFHDHVTTPVHYQGRAMIYIAKSWHNDEAVCAGGTGLSNCRTTGMSNWDPTVNLLVLALGDKEAAGNDDCHWHLDPAAFQGVIWAKNRCEIKDDAYSSGPILANILDIGSSEPNFYAWPPLGQLMPGQLYGTTAQPGQYTITPGTQTG
jgi:hypothetical protein